MKLYPVENKDQHIVAEPDFFYASNSRTHIESLIGVKEADSLYERFGSTNSILTATIEEYVDAGLTTKKASILKAAISIKPENTEQIRCSQDAFHMVQELVNVPIEHFLVLLLNRNNMLLKKVHISKGGLTGTVVDTKVLWHQSIKYLIPNAIVLAHNHPSGNLSPSQSDIELTKKIVEGGKLLDIKVLDHIIVAGDNYLSFMDEGYL